MSDDLVKRLRNTPNWMREGFQNWKDNVRTYDRAPFEAADRIEALEAQITAMEEGLTAVHMAGYMDGQKAAEAKLAKAVEALKHAKLNMPHPDQLIDDTLAELTGGKDD